MSTPASPPNEVESSPLKRFRSAKGELHRIFEQLSSTVNQLHHTLEDASGFLSTDAWWIDHKVGSDPVVQEGDITEARRIVHKTQNNTTKIIETVKRDTMKAVFFGRTSNGKSTLINAMLGNRILPSGIGHTTNCFIRIRGVDEQIPYILSPEDGSRKDLSELKKLAHALYSEKPEEIKTAEILWPRHECKLLQDYVEILDSPGLDISEENDKWIDLHCKDADILVLVANSESALNMTERRFIGHVHKKLVNPSVFICFNRWDCMDDAECDADHKEGVKKQHLESALNLLLQELESGVLNEQPSTVDANNRIFLLSAKEALARRCGTSNSAPLSDQVEQRYTEFERFESNFEQSMSFTAMNKRFEDHVKDGIKMAQDIGRMLGNLCQRVEGFQASMSGSVVCAEEDLQTLRTSTSIFEKDLPSYIETTKNGKMQDNLQHVLKTTGKEALEESLRRFNDVTLFDPEDLQLYQRSIEKHLVKDLTQKLVVLCDDELQTQYASVQQLISESNMSMILKLPRFRQQFPGSTLINLNNITDGFKPDITFRFSFGRFEARYNEFATLSRAWVAQSLQQYLLPVSSDVAALASSPGKPQQELALPASLLQSNGVFIVVAGGLSYFPSVGKLIKYGVLAFAVCYGYQYLTYTQSQKMETFKMQLQDHAGSKLFDLAPQIAYYNTQEWTNHSSALVNIAIDKAKEEKLKLEHTKAENEQRLSDLNKLNGSACRMRHQADEHVSRLQRFEKRYLGDLTWRMPPMSPLVPRSK
eukprot:m.209934 g.209934  ORF g.209934 m.209934 type:complete len:762 (-) comp33057_c0_seq3:325-2610(-)